MSKYKKLTCLNLTTQQPYNETQQQYIKLQQIYPYVYIIVPQQRTDIEEEYIQKIFQLFQQDYIYIKNQLVKISETQVFSSPQVIFFGKIIVDISYGQILSLLNTINGYYYIPKKKEEDLDKMSNKTYNVGQTYIDFGTLTQNMNLQNKVE